MADFSKNKDRQSAQGAQAPRTTQGAKPAQGAQGAQAAKPASRAAQAPKSAQAAQGAQAAKPASRAAQAPKSAQTAQVRSGTKSPAKSAAKSTEKPASTTASAPKKETSGTRAHTHSKTARRAVQSTAALHNTAVIHLEQLALNMQRGANDAALAQVSRSRRLPTRLFLNALGQLLYRLGQQTEYTLLRLGRTLHHAFAAMARGALLLLRTVIRPIGILFAGIWRDLSAPFVQLQHGIAHMFAAMRSASKQGENPLAVGADYFKQGVSAYRHLGATALSYLLPLTAAAVLCLTAWSVLRTPYSLAVTYNDKFLGYVENETVWEEAEHRVLSRIQAVNASDTFDARPVFNVVSVNVAARTTAGDLTDDIIAESSDKIKEATGLYVGNVLVGVCTDDAAVQQMLDTTLAAAQPADDPAAHVEFVNNLSKDRGLYFTDSISNLAQLESTLQTNNWLQTKVVKTETYEDVLEFETIEEESDTIYKGSTRTKQRGVNGKRNVTDEVTYINGVEVERVNVSEEILSEAKPKIVLVGTKQGGYGGSYTGPIAQGSGALGWPVPAYNYTTTEFGRGHRGLDICAAYGTTVLAADGGTVVEAGWHWSWGNYILIDHGNGITTRYAHNSQLLVGVGATVAKGTPISLVGSTGTSSGNHCHFEVAVNGGLANPRSYIIQP